MLDSGDWIHPWGSPHHKTPGFYWMIATTYKLFDINQNSVRLPNLILGFFSVFLLYEIAKIILNQRIAWLAAAILSINFLWLQYCRLGTPDVPMVFLVLLGIFSLLKAELKTEINLRDRKYYNNLLSHLLSNSFWCFLGGFCFGLGLLIRSMMIFLPIVALLPYLILENRRHRLLNNPSLYLGFLIGLLPTLIWLWLSFSYYGNGSVNQLVNFVFRLGSNERGGNGILFYLWNVPITSFPWTLFALVGLFNSLFDLANSSQSKYKLLFIGSPVTLFIELSLFSTRLPHYSLCLFPFISLLAAVGLDNLSQVYTQNSTNLKYKKNRNQVNHQSFHHQYINQPVTSKSKNTGNIKNNEFELNLQISPDKITPPDSLLDSQIRKAPQYFSYGFGCLGILLVIAGIATLIIISNNEIRKYATLSLVLGTTWLISPAIWIARNHFQIKFLTANYWLASFLVPSWLGLAVVCGNGLIGDYNPDFREFIQKPAIIKIINSSSINFVEVGGKTGVLIDFYTKKIGKEVNSLQELAPKSYAWIKKKQADSSSIPHRVIGTVQNYSLVQVSEL
ncbi:ArnT family glycosyltransferase [Brunnivagina elsteri]|uniref:ArnT family glycosyltransferase n=1 Tax=Brunnivagina elsteri TaxID=1247191 RepID=UPI001FEBAFC2|nr:glycosyltransferase family 39 protein [Calothrix elsteri]